MDKHPKTLPQCHTQGTTRRILGRLTGATHKALPGYKLQIRWSRRRGLLLHLRWRTQLVFANGCWGALRRPKLAGNAVA